MTSSDMLVVVRSIFLNPGGKSSAKQRLNLVKFCSHIPAFFCQLESVGKYKIKVCLRRTGCRDGSCIELSPDRFR